MSVKIDIAINDQATPELRRIIRQVEPGGPLGLVLGRALANVLKSHFRERNKTPNKLKGARTNFWSQVAAGVNNPVVVSRGVSVTVSHAAIAQKVFGGRIVPTKKKNLAIAVHADAHGKSPRVFANLAFIPSRKGGVNATTGYLVEGVAAVIARGPNKGQSTTRPKEGGKLLYVLRGFVDQAPDPKALPTDAAMGEAMVKAAGIHLKSL